MEFKVGDIILDEYPGWKGNIYIITDAYDITGHILFDNQKTQYDPIYNLSSKHETLLYRFDNELEELLRD